MERLLDQAADYQAQHPEWRPGQSLYNALTWVHPRLAKRLRGSKFDPFHIDSRIPAFLLYVQRHWDDQG